MTAEIDRLTEDAKFWELVEPTGFCWNWIGRTHLGYGQFSEGGKTWRAHRYSYETLVGLIPDGLVIDHLCRNHSCVNPDHLEPVTTRENTLRGFGITAMQAAQTHCARGHEFSAENTYVTSRNMRHCRECKRQTDRELRASGTKPVNINNSTQCDICGLVRSARNMRRHKRVMHPERIAA